MKEFVACVTIPLAPLASLLPAQPPGPAGPAQVCFRPDQMQGGASNFPDGLLAYRWPPLVGEIHPILYGSNGGTMARLDFRANQFQRCPPAAGLPPHFRYAAGAGDVITNPLDASWLCVAHLERGTTQGNTGFFWGNLGWFRSTDFGQTWAFLGVFVEPATAYTDPLTCVCEIGGGSTCLVGGEYLYCYFRETGYDGKGRAGLAYCRALDVFRAATQGQVAPWRKWGGGPIPSSADPLAVGGGQSESLPGLPPEVDWHSVKYRADRQRYVMVGCPFAEKELTLYDSADAVTWTRAGDPFTRGEPGFKYYPSLVGLNPDERFITGNPWVYYLVSKSDPFDWKGSEVRRRMLTLP